MVASKTDRKRWGKIGRMLHRKFEADAALKQAEEQMEARRRIPKEKLAEAREMLRKMRLRKKSKK